MRKYFSLAAFAALAFIVVNTTDTSAQQPPPAYTGPKTTVKLGVSGRPDQAFLELALRRGYFDHQGLQVETVQAGSGNDFIVPLATGQLQVASGSPNATLFNALNRNINIRIVADFAHVEGAADAVVAIMVRSDLMDSGAVKTVADLKGRTITLGMGRGQYSYMLTNTMLERAGLSWSDVRVQNMAFSDAIVAMANKVIDSAFVIEPLIQTVLRQGTARILVKGGEIENGAHLSLLVFSDEFAKNTDAATRFMIAYLRGARDYREAFFTKRDTHLDAAIQVLTTHLPIKDPNVWKAAYPQTTDVNGRVNIADIKRQADVYRKLGDVTGPTPEIEKFVDTKFAAGAVAVLGQQ